jgi:hypothetical protein
MSGELSLYGLANLDALSVKRQWTLPTKAKVYDLLNFASEVATHHADEYGARSSQAWLGSLISGEYDLENSADMRATSWANWWFEDTHFPASDHSAGTTEFDEAGNADRGPALPMR